MAWPAARWGLTLRATQREKADLGWSVGPVGGGRRGVVAGEEGFHAAEGLVAEGGRAAAAPRPFVLDLAGEAFEGEVLHQDLDARLVLVVAPAVAVVDPQDGLEVVEELLAGQEVLEQPADHRRAPEAAADRISKPSRPSAAIRARAPMSWKRTAARSSAPPEMAILNLRGRNRNSGASVDHWRTISQ
jgi:hypothetical protein